jgi:hypothetical protein
MKWVSGKRDPQQCCASSYEADTGASDFKRIGISE